MDFAITADNREADLVRACAAKDRRAQQTLYESFYGTMMGVCLRYSNNSDDASDILHEGFIKVFRHIGRYRPNTSLHAWIRRIMINTSIDYYRKAIRRRTEDIDVAYDISSKDADAVSRSSEQEILAAVQELSPAYRAVFNLYAIEGFSHKEIAQTLDITESTSRSNLVKARMKLKEALNARFDYGLQK